MSRIKLAALTILFLFPGVMIVLAEAYFIHRRFHDVTHPLSLSVMLISVCVYGVWAEKSFNTLARVWIEGGAAYEPDRDKSGRPVSSVKNRAGMSWTRWWWRDTISFYKNYPSVFLDSELWADMVIGLASIIAVLLSVVCLVVPFIPGAIKSTTEKRRAKKKLAEQNKTP